MGKNGATQRKLRKAVGQNKSKKTGTKCRRLTSAVAALVKRKQPPVSIDAFDLVSRRFGFNASEYLEQGYTVLKNPVLSSDELREAVDVARRVWKVTKGSQNGEFVSLRRGVSEDKRKLFALLHKLNPLLHQLFDGIRLPWSDKSPYSHHNQIQMAVKQPGFKGYDKLSKMRNPLVGHVDQTDGSKKLGRPFCNYSALLGIVLSGDTARRNDAGNLWVAPRSSQLFSRKFRKMGHGPTFVPKQSLAKRFLSKAERPTMKAVLAEPGQAILMQWQTIHGVGPNHSMTDRIHLYFRLTASGRPDGCKKSYEAAMLDPTLETPLLRELAEKQRAKKRNHD